MLKPKNIFYLYAILCLSEHESYGLFSMCVPYRISKHFRMIGRLCLVNPIEVVFSQKGCDNFNADLDVAVIEHYYNMSGGMM